MTRVLIDTSAFVCFLDADDPRNQSIVSAFEQLAGDELVTHGYVVAESLAVTRRRLGVEATISLLDDVLPAVDILPVDVALHAQAQQGYRNSLASGVSFVDHVSLALIEREAISAVVALDADLAASGARLVPASQ